MTGKGTTDSGTSMDTGENAKRGTKRVMVDLAGNEVPDTKRNRAVPNGEDKFNATCLIIHWHEYFIHAYKITERGLIDTIATITSHCETIHNRFRQEMNAKGGLINLIKDESEFVLGEKKLLYKDIHKDLKDIAKLYGYTYIKGDKMKKIIGTLSSLLVLFAGFKNRVSEVRMGNSKIVTGKKADGTTTYASPSNFGLTNTHCVLLSGCTYPPTVASSMKQSLGPMTITTILARTTNPDYQQPWKEAFMQAYRLFPNCKEMADIIAGCTDKQMGLIRTLADISLFGTTRTSHKFFAPMAMVLSLCWKNAIYKALFGSICDTSVPLTLAAIPEPVQYLDRSGKGAFYFWNSCKDLVFKMKETDKLKKEGLCELMFMAAWGTHLEDLSILHFMTGHEFQNRRQYDTGMQGRGEGKETGSFKIISFRYVAKMASATQTDYLEGGSGQLIRHPVFSGRCITRIDLTGELVKFLSPVNEARISTSAATIDKIVMTLDEIKRSIKTEIARDRSIAWGTTSWYKEPVLTLTGLEYGTAYDGVVEAASKYFY